MTRPVTVQNAMTAVQQALDRVSDVVTAPPGYRVERQHTRCIRFVPFDTTQPTILVTYRCNEICAYETDTKKASDE